MMTMAQSLDRFNSDTIKEYFSLVGGKGLTRKADRIDFVCRQVLNEDAIPVIWQRLDPVAQRAVSNAYYNEGFFDEQAFNAQYGELPPRPKRDEYYSAYYRQPILFDLFVIDRQIPADLMPLLAGLALPVERFRLEGIETVPAKITRQRTNCSIYQVETEAVGRADMLTYLQLVEHGALKWGITNRELTAGSVRKVFSSLLAADFHPEPEKITGRHVIRPFGLDIFAKGGRLVTDAGRLSAVGHRYLQSQDPALFLEAFETWVEHGEFDELTHIAQLKGLNSRATRLTPPASRREKIIEALSWCPTHTWISIQDFYRAVKIWQFDFDVELTNWTNLYAGPYRVYGDMSDDDYWFIVHGLYINAVVMEYLATIGAVDVAYVSEDISMLESADLYTDSPLSLHDGLLYFRINNWGAFLLGQANGYVPPQAPRREIFVIDEALQLHVLTDLLPNEQLQLDIVAEPVRDKMYLISRNKLLTAVEAGQEFDRLASFLTENHRGSASGTLIDWLAHLKRNMDVFSEGKTLTMIRLKQRDARTLIEQDEVLSKLCRSLDDSTLVVLVSNLPKFRRRLKELGYLLGSD